MGDVGNIIQATLLMVLLWAIGLAVPFGLDPRCSTLGDETRFAPSALAVSTQVFFWSSLPSH